MLSRDIIVIGASTGGFEALKTIAANLPADLQAAIFIVWHVPPGVVGLLPQALTRAGKVPAGHAVDGEAIEKGRIYVAPPDHHLLVENDRVAVTKGPKENRFRPAVDPLFRSAAYAFGARVIGVVLTGALDDGTSGLWTIKYFGGTAVVQDPSDAEISSMPESALREVEVDYSVPVSEMADLLVSLTNEEITFSETVMKNSELTEIEVKVAAGGNALKSGIMDFGELSPYTCPECRGVLMKLKDRTQPRFRCHTGHAFSSDSLLASVTDTIEDSLWNAIRSIEESMMLLNQMGKYYANGNQLDAATKYFKKAHEAQSRIELIRRTVMNHERLSDDRLRDQADGGRGADHEAEASA